MKNKKRLVGIIIALVVVIAVASIGTFSYAYDVAKKNSIGIDKALNIAMTDAGVNEENTTVTKAKLELDKSIFVFDIEFVENNIIEYEYSIKASDGTILEKYHEIDADNDKDNKKDTPITTVQTITQQTTANEETTKADKNAADKNTAEETTKKSKNENKTTNKNNLDKNISLDEAKNIALKNAGVSKKNATFTSAHKDYDDGTAHYDIEFRTSYYEYEYEIDMTGKIISIDKDAIKKPKTTKKTSANAKYIGVDKAKNIALNNSGHSSKEVTFTKAKLEKEDGIYVYEIEFETSTTEYEYEINAITGKIIDKSVEAIDD